MEFCASNLLSMSKACWPQFDPSLFIEKLRNISKSGGVIFEGFIDFWPKLIHNQTWRRAVDILLIAWCTQARVLPSHAYHCHTVIIVDFRNRFEFKTLIVLMFQIVLFWCSLTISPWRWISLFWHAIISNGILCTSYITLKTDFNHSIMRYQSFD